MPRAHPTTGDRLAGRDGLLVNEIPVPIPGVTGFVTTRVGGISRPPWDTLNLGHTVGDDPRAVDANLERVGRLLRIDPRSWARARMEHGNRVITVDSPGFAGPADGLATREPEVPLAITIADCLPLFLWAPGPVVVLLHCGWRGIARGIVENGVRTLTSLAHCNPGQMGAWIGPGIQVCCYTVDWEVAVQLSALPPPGGGGRVRLDLRRAIRGRLAAQGLAAGKLLASEHCTACRPDLYYSHRRSAASTGRMLAVLCIRAAEDHR